jgi:protein ImuB
MTPGLALAPAASRRILALHLRDFPTDRLRRAAPGLPLGRPLASWIRAGSQRLLAAVDPGAAAAGLLPGQAVADALAILPGLLLYPANPAADAAALHALALWARRYTPLAATEPPDGLLLDITGCDHLFGGEAALLTDALVRLRRAGFAGRGAVAGAAATAAALARARDDNPVVRPGHEAAAVGPLSAGPALRLDQGMAKTLARLGLRRVQDLLAQPRAPLARRFGQELLDRLDAVTGRRAMPIRPVQPPPVLSAALDLPEPLITRAGIEAALEHMLAELEAKLRRASLGARRVTLLAWRVDGMLQRLAIGTGRPTQEAAHLRRLFAETLGRLEPALGFERMVLEAHGCEPLAMGSQMHLGMGAPADTAPALAQLLDRLGQRVSLRRVAPLASHWPEHQVAALEGHAAVPPMPAGWSTPGQPVLLLRRPAPLEVVAALPDGAPSLLRWGGVAQRVHRAAGSRRLEPEWWRAPPDHRPRDYYRLELASGVRLWVFRSARGWRLHGHLS